MADGPQLRNPALIPTRLVAVIFVLATGLLAFEDIREAVLNPAKRPYWILSPFLSLRLWVSVVANVAFYLFAFWILALFFFDTKGKERVVAAGWLLGWLLIPVERFSPVVSVARYIKATAMGVAFLAALAILIEFYRPGDARTERDVSER